MTNPHPNERLSGWALALALFVHLLVLGDPSVFAWATYGILGLGAVLRGRRIFLPAWGERSLFVLAVLSVVFLPDGRSSFSMGRLSGLAGAIFLLRPVTPSRGLGVIFCLLTLLTAAILQRYSGVSPFFIVADGIALMILAQQIHRPPEAARTFWAALGRSLRVVVPVSAVVLLVFWLFPDYSLQPLPGLTGFAGNGVLNPGRVAELSQSRRVALVAKFAETRDVPHADQAYWRGQVLERNDGLYWSLDPARRASGRSLESLPPDRDVPVWSYTQEMAANRGGILPVLDRVHQIEATRGGQDIVVLDQGASVLGAVGTGAIQLAVVSAADSVSDPPESKIAEGCLQVPKDVRENKELREMALHAIPPGSDTPAAMNSLAAFLETQGYSYTLRPGRMLTLGGFLTKARSGFCEHYAAAAANLFRLAGIPARIVLGYRGGEWNPWLRSITVRDSNAHAWVEVWDAASRHWLRFDPTNFVAPDLTARMEREFASDTWPWYRLARSAVTAGLTAGTQRVSEFFVTVGSSEIWESLQPVFLIGLLLALLAWMGKRMIQRIPRTPRDVAFALLEDLERRGADRREPRRTGETPLAWLSRMQCAAAPQEADALHQFAGAYDTCVYQASPDPSLAPLRSSARRLRRLWKSARQRNTSWSAKDPLPH